MHFWKSPWFSMQLVHCQEKSLNFRKFCRALGKVKGGVGNLPVPREYPQFACLWKSPWFSRQLVHCWEKSLDFWKFCRTFQNSSGLLGKVQGSVGNFACSMGISSICMFSEKSMIFQAACALSGKSLDFWKFCRTLGKVQGGVGNLTELWEYAQFALFWKSP